MEARQPWFAELAGLPGTMTVAGDNGVGDTPERYEKIRKSSHQHADYNTEAWGLHP